MLQNDFYPYKCIYDQEKFSEVSLPEKEYFYSNLNMEDINNVDCAHVKLICKAFERKHLRWILWLVC